MRRSRRQQDAKTRHRVTAAVIAALTAVIGAVALSAPARAEEPTGWVGSPADQASIDLPRYVASRTDFTVRVPEGSQICEMSYGEQVRTAPPWTFTFDPERPTYTSGVNITPCDGYTDWVPVDAIVPFSLTGVYASEDARGKAAVTVTNHTEGAPPSRVQVRDGAGRVVGTTTIAAGDTQSIDFSTKKRGRSAQFVVVAGLPDGSAAELPVTVTRGWTPMDSKRRSLYRPCTPITWVYDDRGRPKGATEASMRRDIRGTFSRIAKVTGTRFVESTDRSLISSDHVITIGWRNLGPVSTGGHGGPRWSTLDGQSTVTGDVRLNSNPRSRWTSDAAAGFGQTGWGPAGRGWLIVHEVLHALGLDHTNDRSQVMYPVNHGQARFGAGDIAGMQALFPNKGC